MSKKRTNSTKDNCLKLIAESLPCDDIVHLSQYMAFNFRYFDNSQEPSSDFSKLSHEQLLKIVNKIKNYSNNTTDYWKKQRVGKGKSHILEIYGDFPRNSDFKCPKHIPIGVLWARFRLEGDMRLIGFIISEDQHKECCLAKNIFYIVFIDENHKFYKI
jgi:hypothetical protein